MPGVSSARVVLVLKENNKICYYHDQLCGHISDIAVLAIGVVMIVCSKYHQACF